MARAQWTSFAEQELEEIVYYLGVLQGRPETAEKIAREIRDLADSLAEQPQSGHRHPDFPSTWQYSLHKRWLIIYLERRQGITVIRVVDATRDLPQLFTREL